MGKGDTGAAERPSGRVPLIFTALLLLGAGAVLLWLHSTDRLRPISAATPSIVVELSGPGAAATASVDPAAEPDPGSAAAPSDSAAESSAGPVPQDETSPDAPAESPPDTVFAPEAKVPPPSPGVEPVAAAELPRVPAPLPTDEADGEVEPAERSAEPQPAPAEAASPEPPPETPGTAEQNAAGEQELAAPGAAAGDVGRPAGEAEPAMAGDAETPSAADVGGSPTENPQVAAAWKRLARPFPADETRPRIAVVVAGLGLSEAATTAAIQQLPAEITLSFSPYSNRLKTYVAAARAAGHEVLLDIPMEPASFPRDDPGPQALLTSLGEDANARRLAWTLGRAEGYLGVATYMGSRFTTSAEHLRPVLAELGRRGLLLLDSRAAADSLAASLAAEQGVAHAINDRFIDNEASRVAIDGRLQQIERIARTSGAAVAMGYAYPVTIERLTAWARGLSGKGLTLAPISAVVDRQEVR